MGRRALQQFVQARVRPDLLVVRAAGVVSQVHGSGRGGICDQVHAVAVGTAAARAFRCHRGAGLREAVPQRMEGGPGCTHIARVTSITPPGFPAHSPNHSP
eukprot:4921728-Pleurochrysis_carterae.AAC.1